MRSFIEPDVLKTMYCSALSDQPAPEIRVRIEVRTQGCTILAFFMENKKSEHLIFREFHGR